MTCYFISSGGAKTDAEETNTKMLQPTEKKLRSPNEKSPYEKSPKKSPVKKSPKKIKKAKMSRDITSLGKHIFYILNQELRMEMVLKSIGLGLIYKWLSCNFPFINLYYYSFWQGQMKRIISILQT